MIAGALTRKDSVPTTLRSFCNGEVCKYCMVRVKAQAENGSPETVNSPPTDRELQIQDLGKTNLMITKRMKNKNLIYLE